MPGRRINYTKPALRQRPGKSYIYKKGLILHIGGLTQISPLTIDDLPDQSSCIGLEYAYEMAHLPKEDMDGSV